jgi:hypothetical protein
VENHGRHPVSDRFSRVRQRADDLREEEKEMYITDLVWWGYTAFVAVTALFLLYFAAKVRQKGD